MACLACCIGPILGVLGAIAALGLVSSIIGTAGLVIAPAAVATFIILRRRRGKTCSTDAGPVPVVLNQRS